MGSYGGGTEPAWPTDGGTVVQSYITWHDEGAFYTWTTVAGHDGVGSTGQEPTTDDGWTDFGASCCDQKLALICFEQ